MILDDKRMYDTPEQIAEAIDILKHINESLRDRLRKEGISDIFIDELATVMTKVIHYSIYL